MKKLLAIILCLGLTLSFVACGNDEQKAVAPKDDAQTSQNDSIESEIESIIEEVESKVESAVKEVTAKFSRGKIVGNVYSSDYSGIKFTKPISWDYASDDDIVELLGGTIGQDTLDEIIAAGSGYDMMAADGVDNSVIVGYENLAASNATSMSEQEYIELVASSLTSMGYTAKNSTSAILSGYTYMKQELTLSANGVTVTQAIYARKIGDYMSFAILSTSESSVAALEAMF